MQKNCYMWWAHLGSNQGPTGYEPVALPAELWARVDFHSRNKKHAHSIKNCQVKSSSPKSQMLKKAYVVLNALTL